MSDATDVLHAIDQLRRDLSGYHGQLKAHNDLQRHCDNQRKRIVELEGLYAKAKSERDDIAIVFSKEYDRSEFLMRENAKLRELCGELWDGYMDPPCEECPLKGLPACADCPICAREAAVVARMRELGIEVDA